MTSGTKVTTDPESTRNPNKESAGIVASDSLAAESKQSGGGFAADGNPLSSTQQPARSLTANTTDTSAATVLPPAVDAQARLESEEWSEAAQLNAGRSLSGGSANPSHTVNGPASTGVQPSMPKGANLKEGGFDSDAPNASFSTDIGGKRDPGRKALNDFAARQGDGAMAGGIGDSSTGGISNDGQFDKLGETSA